MSEKITTLRGYDSAVESAAFGPDGTRIVTVTTNNTAVMVPHPRAGT
jgi:hypothetical protein